MLCQECGNDNSDQNRFCGSCGTKLAPQNGGSAEYVGAPNTTGDISSLFRQEVEQQQAGLRRLRHKTAKTYSEIATSAPFEPSGADAPDDNIADLRQRLGASGGGERAGGAAQHAADTSDNSISGPSFLGLSSSEPRNDRDLTYLYDDEERPGRARAFVAIVILLAFVAFMAFEWKQNPNWQSAIIGRLGMRGSSQPKQPATSTGVQDQAQNAQASTEASASTPNTAGPGSAPAQQDAKAGTDQPKPDTPAGSEVRSNPSADKAPGSTGADVAETEGHQPTTEDNNSVAATPSEPQQPAQTDSTGDTGEQQSADTEGVDAAKSTDASDAATAKSDTSAVATAKSKEPAAKRASTRNERSTQKSRYASEEPGSDLVARADAYLYGRGVPRNCDQALVLLRTAANRGNASARSKLGGLYATGNCVSLDRAEAYNWFTLAREAGSKSVWVERSREMLWSEMSQDEKARTLQGRQ